MLSIKYKDKPGKLTLEGNGEARVRGSIATRRADVNSIFADIN